jgi:hypothetical protein
MAMYLLLFLNAIVLSGIAAYYSVVGLTAIFSAALIPVVIMGGSLEVAKLVVASWLYRYWNSIPLLMRGYFTVALVILMLITSMGIFGFLSKAHSDQSLVSGDVAAKIAVYDEKIKTAKENIDANRRALKQMDESVDQVMGRSQDEKGADKAVALRKGQAKERTRLLSDIAAEQKAIAQLSEARAPIAAEVRKVEAEVGPIKYIAAMIYGDNPSENSLERSVRWLIILLIAVFDPLAVLMLIAANLTQIKSKEWQEEKAKDTNPVIPSEDLSVTITEPVVVETATEPAPKEEVNLEWAPEPVVEEVNLEWAPEELEPVVEKSILEQHPYLDQPFIHFQGLEPMVYKPEPIAEEVVVEEPVVVPEVDIPNLERPGDYLTPPVVDEVPVVVDESPEFEGVKIEDEWVQTGPALEKPKRTRKVKEQKVEDTYNEGKNVSMDFNSEVDKMIEDGDDNGLEGIYKKIVKELGKKNRAKTTHWGPIKSSPTDKQ